MNVRAIAAFLLLLAPCSLLPGSEPARPTPPATNWVLPIFSDKEGYRVLRATGSEAAPGKNDTLLVTNLGITIFTGDASERVETVFLSPLATFSTKDNRARGDKTVRVVRDDFEATATSWEYDHARKHVTLDGDVRIVFNAEIKDLLK
jgi:hypothetical protein